MLLTNFGTSRWCQWRMVPWNVNVISVSVANVSLQDSRFTEYPLSILSPLDDGARARHRAMGRLLDFLEGREIGADSRLTPQKRLRFKSMLRAVDGRSNGATYREIAESLFGARRVASEPWKTSPLRDTTIRLVRDGLAMVAGGYLDLLRR